MESDRVTQSLRMQNLTDWRSVMTDILVEAQEVAGARWRLTETRADRKTRLRATLLAKVEAILNRRWQETVPAPSLTGLSEATETIGSYHTTYRLFDSSGRSIICHLCGHNDRWIPQGDVEHHIVRLFVCEHEPLRLGHGLVRQISTVAIHLIQRLEVTHPEDI